MKKALDKLTLGTVQFGLEYGINNNKGKPSKEKSLEMLAFAFEKGIRTFDTAYAYGDAEEILGEFSQIHGLRNKLKIVTKLKPNIIAERRGNLYDIIAKNLRESLRRLKMDYVDGYLLHTPEYVRNDDVIKSLVNLKNEGLVKNIGISVYEEDDAIYAAKLPDIDYIQIPYSIFDQRMDKTDFFSLARKKHKTVFARSTFLQGLIFMPEERIPTYLKKARIYLKELDEIIGKYNLSRAEAALLFSYKNPNIDYVVFGVDNIKQLAEDIEIAGKNIDREKCLAELKDRFINIEKNIIFPSLWKK